MQNQMNFKTLVVRETRQYIPQIGHAPAAFGVQPVNQDADAVTLVSCQSFHRIRDVIFAAVNFLSVVADCSRSDRTVSDARDEIFIGAGDRRQAEPADKIVKEGF